MKISDKSISNKKLNKKITKKKIILGSVISLFSILVILSLSAYFVVYSYINKMNIVKATDSKETFNEQEYLDETNIEEDLTANIEADGKLDNELEYNDINGNEVNPEVTNSPQEVVNTVEDKIRNNMEENSTQIMSNKNVLNVLLIGGDSRKAGGSGRSDAMIIVSINKNTKEIIATSLLRDIYLNIPGRSNNTRINNAYAYGGAELLMETIKTNFKIEIDRYVSLDFYSFMDVVDAVGGVTLEIKRNEIEVTNGYIRGINNLLGLDGESDIIKEPGTYLLTGKQALGYARNRYDGTDFERTARQRKVLEQVFVNVKDSNIIELNNLLNIILPQITTNLTEGEIFSMILNLPAYSKYALKQWSIPVKESYSFMRIRGMDVIGIDFEENIKEIRERVYGE